MLISRNYDNGSDNGILRGQKGDGIRIGHGKGRSGDEGGGGIDRGQVRVGGEGVCEETQFQLWYGLWSEPVTTLLSMHSSISIKYQIFMCIL